jgi:recombination protein RecA
MVFINQIRQKIGVMFGNPETTSGGLALKFYASVRLDIRKVGTIKDGEEAIGSEVKVKVVKNKVAPPFRLAQFDLMHDHGISREGDLINLAIEDKIVEKSGAWLNYGEVRLGQGKENAKQFLRDNPKLVEEISKKILEKRGMLNLPPVAANGQAESEPAAPAAPAPKSGESSGRKRASAAAEA